MEALQKAFSRPLLLNQVMLNKGLSNLGDIRRLDMALDKLIQGAERRPPQATQERHALMFMATGQPITMVVVGGSVSSGSGIQHRTNVWVTRLFDWVSLSFPQAEHKLINLAMPATSSSYYSPCILDMLPFDVDLVVLEYSFNDFFHQTSESVDDPTRCRTCGLRVLSLLVLALAVT